MTETETTINYSVTNYDRPFSQKELIDIRDKTLKKNKFNINLYIVHEKCGHFYRVKRYSKKEKELLSSENRDIGNCSVCWNIKNNKNRCEENLIEDYHKMFYCEAINGEEPNLSHYIIDTELTFLHWLNNPN